MELLAIGLVGYVAGLLVTRLILNWHQGRRDPYYGLPVKDDKTTDEQKQHLAELAEWDAQFTRETGKRIDSTGRLIPEQITVRGSWQELYAPGLRAMFQDDSVLLREKALWDQLNSIENRMSQRSGLMQGLAGSLGSPASLLGLHGSHKSSRSRKPES